MEVPSFYRPVATEKLLSAWCPVVARVAAVPPAFHSKDFHPRYIHMHVLDDFTRALADIARDARNLDVLPALRRDGALGSRGPRKLRHRSGKPLRDPHSAVGGGSSTASTMSAVFLFFFRQGLVGRRDFARVAVRRAPSLSLVVRTGISGAFGPSCSTKQISCGRHLPIDVFFSGAVL